MLPGDWICNSSLRWPSNSTLFGSAEVTVVCSLSQSSIEDSPFALMSTSLQTLSLATNNVPGCDTIRTVGSPAAGVGSWIDVRVTPAHLSGAPYQIVSITSVGDGNFDVKLDRPVLYAALAASAIAVSVVPCRYVRIFGNGMRVVGVCNGYMELQGAIDCQIEDIIFDASTASGTAKAGLTVDTFSLRDKFTRIRAVGPGISGASVGMWCIGEDHRFTDCEVSDWTVGIVASDMHHNDLRGTVVHDCGTGITVTSDGGATFTPSNSARIVGLTAYGCTTGGVVTQGARNITLYGCTFRYNTASGCVLSDLNGAPVNTRFVGCAFVNNGSNGFADVATAKGTQLIGCDISDNAAAGLLVSGNVTAIGLTSSGGNATATVQVIAGGRCVVDGFDITCAISGAPGTLTQSTGIIRLVNGRMALTGTANLACQCTGTARCEFIGIRFSFGLASQGIQATGGVVVVDDCSADGSSVASSVAVNIGGGATARIGRCNFDACVTPFNYNPGSLWSRSIDGIPETHVVATSSTPVDVFFRDLKKSDRISLTRVMNDGTPGKTPLVQKTVDTVTPTNSKFTVTADTNDTSMYAYTID